MIYPPDDYAALMRVAEDCRRVVEFGPGDSTQALLDAGCHFILSLEHNFGWREKMRRRYKDEARVVIDVYDNFPEVIVPTNERYDLCHVDSPIGAKGKLRVIHPGQENLSRYNTLKYALDHAEIVLLHDTDRQDEKNSIEALGAKYEMLSTKLARVWR